MRKVILAGLVGLSAGTAVLASASALTISSAGLGAGSGVTASCDDTVSTGYATTFDATEGYQVTGVVVSGIAAACNNQTVGATITDAANNAVATATPVTISGSANSVTLPMGSPVSMGSVGRVHVVIG